MRIDGSIILDTQCIFEKDLPKVIVGNTWYITIQNKGDKVGKLWVPDVNGNPVCIGIQDITSLETRIQNAENQGGTIDDLLEGSTIEAMVDPDVWYDTWQDIETGLRHEMTVYYKCHKIIIR